MPIIILNEHKRYWYISKPIMNKLDKHDQKSLHDVF